MDEQQSPQCGLAPPPLARPGTGGSGGHENQFSVKTEAVAAAMREPQNKHPREAADAALVMVKLAHVAAHAGHAPAACLAKGKLGIERVAARLTRYWSGSCPPPAELAPTDAAAVGGNVNLLAHLPLVSALHGLFCKSACSSSCPFRQRGAEGC